MSSPVIGDSFDQFQVLLRESLGTAVTNLVSKTEDPTWPLVMTSRNVTKMGRKTGTDEGAAGYEAKWDVLLQQGGIITGADFGETTTMGMGPDGRLIMGMGASSLHGDPTKTPQRSYMQLKSFLKKMRGNVTINRDQLEAQMVTDPIENIAMSHIEDAADLVKSLASSLFWSDGNGTIGYAGAAATFTETTVVWVVLKKSQIHNFVKGQRYVAARKTSTVHDTPISGNGANANSPSVLRCVGIDKRNKKVAFQSEAGEGSVTVASGDAFILKGLWKFSGTAKSLAPNGVHNLLVNSGNFPDTSIAVTDYPELQAIVEGDGEETTAELVLPEPERLDKILDIMTSDGSEAPPVLCAESGVWTLYSHLERRATQLVTVPQGEAFMPDGGVRLPVYSFNGKQFVRLSSPKCRPNTIYGLDFSTFMRFMPNDLTLRWVMSQGGMAGLGNIFRPVFVGTQLSDLSVAEFELWSQLAMTEPQKNLIYYGVHNLDTYDSAA